MFCDRLAVLTMLLLRVSSISQEFNCKENQPNCFWTRAAASNWYAAYADCTQSGGSLISSDYFANLENWISDINNDNKTDVKVWSSLHRINNRFQVLHNPDPQFRLVPEDDWMPGHPLLRWPNNPNCVVVNRNKKYESVSCNDSFPVVCGISKNRKNTTNNLDFHQVALKVELTVDSTSSSMMRMDHLLDIDRKKTSLIFACNVSNNGSRMLEYSWIKDGVFLEDNGPSLIPSGVNDKSKPVSETMYQKQGTYQCQVKEFGALEVSTSNPIILTYSQVLNGIVTIKTASTNQPLNDFDVISKVQKFILQEVLKKKMKYTDIEYAFLNPMYSIAGPDAIEYRNSLYIDVPHKYPEEDLFHLLDTVSKEVESNSELNSLPGIGKILVSWATYCQNQTVLTQANSFPASDHIEIFWPRSWAASIVKPDKDILCVYEDNNVKRFTGQCLANFTHGASLVANKNECKRIVAQLEPRCRQGFHWIEHMKLCYKITGDKSWNESWAVCMNEWPTFSMSGVNYDDHLAVISHLQKSVKNLDDVWLPVRRSSVYGPLLYYSINQDPVGISLMDRIENWTELVEEECMTIDRNGKKHVSDCSKTVPGVCVHRPNRNKTSAQLQNLCPAPWYGYVIEQGRLTCFYLITSESPMNWNEANQRCGKENENFGMLANISMATFEDSGKAEQWKTVISKNHTLELNSSWIGLDWSESYKSYCWRSSGVGCKFDHFNWDSSVDWINGYYGVMNDAGLWNLVSSTSLRNQVLCQAEVNLIVTQNIRIHENPHDNNVLVEMVEQQMGVTPRSFDDLSDFFNFSQQPISLFQSTLTGSNIDCYLDGERHETMNKFPFNFSLHSNFSTAKTFNCEGWIGWPRRFVRSDPFIVLRPPKFHQIFSVLLDINRTDLQTEQKNSIDFRPDHLTDVVYRLEKIATKEFDLNVTGHRLWAHEQQLRMLVRVVIINKKRNPTQQKNWTELLKNAFIQHGNSQLSYQVIHIRNSDACESETSTISSADRVFNITWNSARIGFKSEPLNPCQTEDGKPILRMCLGNPNTGAFWEKLFFPDDGDCKEPSDRLKILRKLNDEVVSNATNPSAALQNLSKMVTSFSADTPSGVELGEAARLLHASVARIAHPSETQFQETSQILSTMLASPNQLKKAQSLTGVSNALVKSLERVMGQVNIPNGGSVNFSDRYMTELMLVNENVFGYGANVNKDELVVNGTRILQNDQKSVEDELIKRDIAIILPIEDIRKQKGLDNSTSLRLSFSVFANSDLFGQNRNITLLTKGNSYFSLDSPVIIAQVENSSLANLNKNVRIFFRSRSTHNSSITPVCVFWDAQSVSGGWSPSGCQYVGNVNDFYICECNHLTPLALLFPYFDEDGTMDEVHRITLSFISVIGCVASMVGLSLVILTFLLFRKWRKSLGNKILFNFSLALFCVMGCFLSAGIVTFDLRLCKTAAAAMHYFLLSSFAWMAVEGIYQYLNYVVIIGAKNYKSCFMRRAGPVAWGLPILPVLGILLYDSNLYTALKNDFCWMQFEAFYFTVLAPVCLILLFNIFIFLGVLKSVLCLRMRADFRTSQSVQTRSWYQFRMAVCIFFLLGLAWIFGFLSVGYSQIIFAYFFCIFNSLQGFIIFIFFVLRERNARKLWFDFAHSWNDDKSTSRTLHSFRSTDHTPLKNNSKY